MLSAHVDLPISVPVLVYLRSKGETMLIIVTNASPKDSVDSAYHLTKSTFAYILAHIQVLIPNVSLSINFKPTTKSQS